MTVELSQKALPHKKASSSPKLTRQKVFRYCWNNPAASYRQIAEELHLSLSNVRVTLHRLRRLPDISRRCPECFAPSLLAGVCQACGFEPASFSLPLEVDFESQSPTNALHAGNMLGSEVDFNQLGIKGRYANDGILLKQRMNGALEETLSRDVKSLVMEDLKAYYPSESITDLAGKLCLKEVAEFRSRYPLLAKSKNVKRQLAANMVGRLQLLYPFLGRPHLHEVTQLQ
jgi:hypothetical protein